MPPELPTSQVEAVSKGSRKYRTGKPCKYGHVSERWTLTGNCCQCNVDRIGARRERMKQALEEAREATSS